MLRYVHFTIAAAGLKQSTMMRSFRDDARHLNESEQRAVSKEKKKNKRCPETRRFTQSLSVPCRWVLTQVSFCVFNAREVVALKECALTAQTDGRVWLSSVKNFEPGNSRMPPLFPFDYLTVPAVDDPRWKRRVTSEEEC